MFFIWRLQEPLPPRCWAQLASCLFVLFVLYKKSMPVPLHLRRPELTLVKRILALGFSPFLILATDSIIIIAMNAVLQYHGGPGYGDTLITCATIVQSYMMLITSPMLALPEAPSRLSALITEPISRSG